MGPQIILHNVTLALSPLRGAYHTHRAFYIMWAAWSAVLVACQLMAVTALLTNHRAYYRRHRMRTVLLLRLLRVGMLAHIAAFPPMALIPSTSFAGTLLVHTGALFHLDQVIGRAGTEEGWRKGDGGGHTARCAFWAVS